MKKKSPNADSLYSLATTPLINILPPTKKSPFLCRYSKAETMYMQRSGKIKRGFQSIVPCIFSFQGVTLNFVEKNILETSMSLFFLHHTRALHFSCI